MEVASFWPCKLVVALGIREAQVHMGGVERGVMGSAMWAWLSLCTVLGTGWLAGWTSFGLPPHRAESASVPFSQVYIYAAMLKTDWGAGILGVGPCRAREVLLEFPDIATPKEVRLLRAGARLNPTRAPPSSPLCSSCSALFPAPHAAV